MNIQEFNAARRVYLTDDEDILAACAVGVYRPCLRVHLPLGMSYYDLTAAERSVVWAFERFLQRGELDDKTGAWIFRGIGDEPSHAETWNINLVGFRVLEGAAGYDDYEELVDGECTDLGWAKFVHLPTGGDGSRSMMPHPDLCRVICRGHRAASLTHPTTVWEDTTMDPRIQHQLAREAREKAATMVTHMHIEREVNGTVAVVWVSTPDRVLELRELLDEDGLLPADVMETQACDAGFVDRRTGERVLRVIPAPDAAGRRDWAEYRQISDAIEAAHRHIDRHARKALFDLQAAVALDQRSSPRRRPAIA